jgi:hypothetical protein
VGSVEESLARLAESAALDVTCLYRSAAPAQPDEILLCRLAGSAERADLYLRLRRWAASVDPAEECLCQTAALVEMDEVHLYQSGALAEQDAAPLCHSIVSDALQDLLVSMAFELPESQACA